MMMTRHSSSTSLSQPPKVGETLEDKYQGLTMTTTGWPSTCPHACESLRAGWIIGTCSRRWRQYRHQRTRPTPAPRHRHPTCSAAYMKAPTVQHWAIAACKGYQGNNEWIWVYSFGVSVMRYRRYTYTTVLLWTAQVWYSCMTTVYSGENSTNSARGCYPICKRDWNETPRESTIRIAIPFSHPTILRSLVKNYHRNCLYRWEKS